MLQRRTAGRSRPKLRARLCERSLRLLAATLALTVVSMSPAGAAQDAPLGSARAIERDVLEHLAGGRQSKAEEVLEHALRDHGDDQGLVFLDACCTRSRFDVAAARPLFQKVVALDAASLQGQCAAEMLQLDSGIAVAAHFDALSALVDAHPDDVLLRWMIAVQCRALDRNEEGVAHYRRLLRTWQPGPSLVHQTYGNLLSELGEHEAALVERKLAVEQEPCDWSLKSLGNTLRQLERYEEASDAYARAVEFLPKDGKCWANYAWSLMKAKRYEEALPKAERATQLGANAWLCWGYCLQSLGRKDEAVAKYREAVRLDPDDGFSRKKLEELEGGAPAASATADDGYLAYAGNDITQLLVTHTDAEGQESHDLDLAFAERVLAELSAHARNYPPEFRSDDERALAKRDAGRLADLLHIVTQEADATDELLFLSARVNAVAHNLDIEGAGERAGTYFTRFLARNPSHPQGNYQYGVFLASTATGQPMAGNYLERAAVLGVDDAYYSLAMLSLVQGDQEQAAKQLETYLSKQPGDEQAAKLLEVLRLKDGKLKVNVER